MNNVFVPALLTAVVAYLMGSTTFAVVVTRLFTGKDIRTMGSGNAGMTNVLRSVGKGAAAITILGDILKGTAAVYVGEYIFTKFVVTDIILGMWIAALFAVLGHLFPVYFSFKGGKGVSVAAGSVVAITPFIVLGLLLLLLAIIAKTKIVSLASITVAVLYPFCVAVYTYKFGGNILLNTIFSAILALLVIFMHRENIKRLLNGTEYKFGQKKT